MRTTSTAHTETIDPSRWLGSVVVGIALAMAVLAAGVPFATDASAAARDDGAIAPPLPEPCLNIFTCGTDKLPPGKVDPGPPRRQADLPTPSIAVEQVEAVGTPTGQYVRLEIEVTNWEAYHETLFRSGRQYPACGEAGNKFRTWVDILDGTDGRVHYRYCAIGTPVGLSKLSLFVRNGDPVPERIAVRLIDNTTDRVVVSHPTAVPPISRVRTWYSEAEQANLEFAAEYWEIPVWEVQKAGVMAIRFINGVAGTTGSKPLRPRPKMEAPVSYYTDWAPDERHALEWVSQYHDLNYAETQKLGAIVMIYVAAVAQR